ncbi:Protein of unknown function [Gryllus bimaculatus]|nr:Protein of unknown function [Gryllus bimaculatus]
MAVRVQAHLLKDGNSEFDDVWEEVRMELLLFWALERRNVKREVYKEGLVGRGRARRGAARMAQFAARAAPVQQSGANALSRPPALRVGGTEHSTLSAREVLRSPRVARDSRLCLAYFLPPQFVPMYFHLGEHEVVVIGDDIEWIKTRMYKLEVSALEGAVSARYTGV